jgi:hypothetical protein
VPWLLLLLLLLVDSLLLLLPLSPLHLEQVELHLQ